MPCIYIELEYASRAMFVSLTRYNNVVYQKTPTRANFNQNRRGKNPKIFNLRHGTSTPMQDEGLKRDPVQIKGLLSTSMLTQPCMKHETRLYYMQKKLCARWGKSEECNSIYFFLFSACYSQQTHITEDTCLL